MKRLLSTIFCIGLMTVSFAQNTQDEIEVIRDIAATERRAIVAENLMLSEEESKLFWPVYDDYRAEARKIGTREIELITKFAENYETMTDEVAIQLMEDVSKINSDQGKMKANYRVKLLKVIPGKLVLRAIQIENKLDIIIEFGLAQEIPLIMK